MPLEYVNGRSLNIKPMDVTLIDNLLGRRQQRYNTAVEQKEAALQEALSRGYLNQTDRDIYESKIRNKFQNVSDKYSGDLSAGYDEIKSAVTDVKTDPYIQANQRLLDEAKLERAMEVQYGANAYIPKSVMDERLYDNQGNLKDPSSFRAQVYNLDDFYKTGLQTGSEVAKSAMSDYTSILGGQYFQRQLGLKDMEEAQAYLMQNPQVVTDKIKQFGLDPNDPGVRDRVANRIAQGFLDSSIGGTEKIKNENYLSDKEEALIKLKLDEEEEKINLLKARTNYYNSKAQPDGPKTAYKPDLASNNIGTVEGNAVKDVINNKKKLEEVAASRIEKEGLTALLKERIKGSATDDVEVPNLNYETEVNSHYDSKIATLHDKIKEYTAYINTSITDLSGKKAKYADELPKIKAQYSQLVSEKIDALAKNKSIVVDSEYPTKAGFTGKIISPSKKMSWKEVNNLYFSTLQEVKELESFEANLTNNINAEIVLSLNDRITKKTKNQIETEGLASIQNIDTKLNFINTRNASRPSATTKLVNLTKEQAVNLLGKNVISEKKIKDLDLSNASYDIYSGAMKVGGEVIELNELGMADPNAIRLLTEIKELYGHYIQGSYEIGNDFVLPYNIVLNPTDSNSPMQQYYIDSRDQYAEYTINGKIISPPKLLKMTSEGKIVQISDADIGAEVNLLMQKILPTTLKNDREKTTTITPYNTGEEDVEDEDKD